MRLSTCQSSTGYWYGYQGSEKDDEVKGEGNSYTTHFRQLDPRIGRWLSLDPVTQPWQSPYNSMDNNPIWFNDVLGNKGESTHTDKDGKVIAIFDDGDNSVYKHDDNSEGGSPTLESITKGHLKSNSAGGSKVGETLTSFGFADFDKYQESGGKVIVPAKGAKIKFGSTWASQKVASILATEPSAAEYALNAKQNGDWDLKTKVPSGESSAFGSLLFGKYASARDAGNFIAGVVAEASNIPTSVIDYGYGVYDDSRNDFLRSAQIIIEDVNRLIESPIVGGTMIKARALYGEDELTKQGINAGKKYAKGH